MLRTALHFHLLLVGLILLTSSCATVLSSKVSPVKIQSSERVNYIYQNDTLLNRSDEPLGANFINDRNALELQYFNGKHSNKISIQPIRAQEYYLNVLTPAWAGFLVDELSPRKWAYPRKIYIDVEEGSYLPYFPMDSLRLNKFSNRFSLSPFSAIGDHNPGVDMAYQYHFSDRYAIQLSYEAMVSADSELGRNSSGYRAGLEFKYYLRNTESIRFYLSTNLAYLNKNYTSNQAFVNSQLQNNNNLIEEGDIFYEDIRVQKQFFSITTRFGAEYFLSDRWILDGYIGLGPRFRRVEHLNAPANGVHFDEESSWFNIVYGSNQEVNNASANFDLNVRIGFRF